MLAHAHTVHLQGNTKTISSYVVLALLVDAYILYSRRHKPELRGVGVLGDTRHDMVRNEGVGDRYTDVPQVPEMSSGQVVPSSGGNAGTQGRGGG